MMESWRKNLCALWFAQILAMVALSAIVPFLPLYIRELGVNDHTIARQWSGLIFAAPFLSALITSPIWGAVGDRYGRKAMVLRAVLGIAIALVLMGMAKSVHELFLWRLVQGAISGFIAASLGFVVAETPSEHHGYAIGVLQTSQSIGAVIGPFLGGIIAQYIGMRSVFGVMSGLLLVSFFVVMTMVRESIHPDVTHENPNISVADNLRVAFSIPGFVVAITCIVLSQMGAVMPSPQMPYFLEELGVSEGQIQLLTGVVVSITGLSTLIASPLVGRQVDRRGAVRIVHWSAIVASGMFVVQAIAQSVGVVLVARAILGIALSGLVPALNTYVSTRIPAGRQSGLMSLASSAMLLGNLLAPPIGGQLSVYLGLRSVFIAALVCSGSIPIILWWMHRRQATQQAAMIRS